jgi:methylenetetrahydrofolate reductase (NADPH)
MRLADLLADYSLETTAKQAPEIEHASDLAAPATRIYITFLPGESLDARLAAARTVKQLGFVPVPHISARRLASRAALETMLDRLRAEAALDAVFVVAGDLQDPEGPYEDALAVIRSGLLGEYGVRHVGIAGYPEGHPNISRDKLERALHDKSAALSELGLTSDITTQFSFDADSVLSWLDEIRDQGVDAPVRIGLAGPANLGALLRFAARCGVAASSKVISKYGASITRMFDAATPDLILHTLADRLAPAIHGDVKVHLYPFGGVRMTAEWAGKFSRNLAAQAVG